MKTISLCIKLSYGRFLCLLGIHKYDPEKCWEFYDWDENYMYSSNNCERCGKPKVVTH